MAVTERERMRLDTDGLAFRRQRVTSSDARRFPPPAETDVADAHGQRREKSMQDRHRQDPMLFLVPVAGEGRSVEDLGEEAVAAVLRAAEEGLSALSGSDSPKLRFLRSVAASASTLLPESPVRQVRLG